MKKKLKIALAVLAVGSAGVVSWFWGYHSQKSSDNIPSLSLIAQMEEADVASLLTGYRRIQLRTVWGEPDRAASTEDAWGIQEGMLLVVSYSEQDRAIICTLSKEMS